MVILAPSRTSQRMSEAKKASLTANEGTQLTHESRTSHGANAQLLAEAQKQVFSKKVLIKIVPRKTN